MRIFLYNLSSAFHMQIHKAAEFNEVVIIDDDVFGPLGNIHTRDLIGNMYI